MWLELEGRSARNWAVLARRRSKRRQQGDRSDSSRLRERAYILFHLTDLLLLAFPATPHLLTCPPVPSVPQVAQILHQHLGNFQPSWPVTPGILPGPSHGQ